MSKIKMRCIACGKWFQSANAKEVTCPDCMQKARKEKMAAKTGTPPLQKTPGQGMSGIGTPAHSTPPPPKPKPAASGTSHWFDSVDDVKVREPEAPPKPKPPSSPTPRETYGGPERFGGRGSGGPGNYREDRGPGSYRGPGNYREDRGSSGPGGYRGSGGYRSGNMSASIVGGIGQRPRQPMEGGFGRGPRPGESRERFPKKPGKPGAQKKPRPALPPKPKREKIPPPAPFVPTPEQVAQVEVRYAELAVPTEFDGIRTQISKELSIPKKAVKKIIKEFREREGIPSWWETQTYKGDSEEKEKIKAAYEPFLPVPPVGVHRKIAEELSLKPGIVYQAIKAIRLEMNLPQYNDPTVHGIELKSSKQAKPDSNDHPESAATPAEGAETATPAAAPQEKQEIQETTSPSLEKTETPAAPTEAIAATGAMGNAPEGENPTE